MRLGRVRQDEQVDGIAALSEIAFWLERSRAETHRVQAYRKAAWALSALPEDEIAERVVAGTLT
jgi:putative hydrolase